MHRRGERMSRSNASRIRSSFAARASLGFSLVELIISMAVMSVLAVGISSAVLVSVRSIETSSSPSACIRSAADVSNQMVRELNEALAVSERSARAVTFSVPDRDNDGVSEEIRYWWSGTPGDGLMRRYNAEPETALLTNVFAFALSYDLVPVPVPAMGSDKLVAGHHSAKDLSSFRINTLDWASQSFRVSLPAGASSWKITRAVFYCRQVGGASGQLTLQFRSAQSDGRPGNTLYAENTVPESEFKTSHAWYSIAVPYSGNLSPNGSYCLLLKGNWTDVCELRYHSKKAVEEGYVFMTTSLGGLIWTVRSKQALLFEVYGTCSGGDSDRNTEMRLGTVRWELQAGRDASNRLYAGAQLANLPE